MTKCVKTYYVSSIKSINVILQSIVLIILVLVEQEAPLVEGQPPASRGGVAKLTSLNRPGSRGAEPGARVKG